MCKKYKHAKFSTDTSEKTYSKDNKHERKIPNIFTSDKQNTQLRGILLDSLTNDDLTVQII